MSTLVAESLLPVDSLECLVLVDNVTDSLSTVPAGVVNENTTLRKAGMREISGEAKCCAHHGLSLVLAARSNDEVHHVMFDAGPEAYTVTRNGDRLGVPFKDIEALALSHEYKPGPEVTDDAGLLEFCRNQGATIFHPVGTARMGKDKMAVVGDRLRVHGIAGLRVIDCSIMPTLVSGNTNAPAVMIAEKAVDLIKQDYSHSGRRVAALRVSNHQTSPKTREAASESK